MELVTAQPWLCIHGEQSYQDREDEVSQVQ